MNRRGRIDNKIVTVVDKKDLLNQEIKYNYTAIEYQDIVFPIRAKNDNKPGAYMSGDIIKFKFPDREEMNNYTVENNIVDMANVSSMSDLIEKNNRLKELECVTLTSTDGEITRLVISKNDRPEMAALKEAINSKNIDLNKYEARFDGNYNNDKRLLFKESISIGKLKSTANALDMKLTLIIEDKNKDVPNPIGKRIIAEINEGEGLEDETE